MKKLLGFSTVVTALLLTSTTALAITADEARFEELTKQIQALETKLAGLRSQDKSLKTELSYLDGQMTLTQAKIGQAQVNLARKEQELITIGASIEELKAKIIRLADAVDRQKTAFNARLQEQYKRGTSMPVIELFLSSQSFSDIVSELKYLKLAETNDQNLISQMTDSKEAYKEQTTLLEIKKEEAIKVKAQIEATKTQLTNYQAQLVEQSTIKKQLLADTQNDEAKYQQLLSQALAERDAIAGAFAGADFTNAKEIKAGDVIAVMGNSGYPSCSTGAHLHFEVHKNGVLVNAEDYLENKTVVSEGGSSTASIGGGHWPWPMKSPIVTQRFGKTPYSWRYASGSHSGIDLVSNESYLIYAPADGKIIKKSGVCGSSTYNYVLIRHSDGVESLYLHIQ